MRHSCQVLIAPMIVAFRSRLMHDENACAPSLGRPALGWWRGACVYCNDIELTGRTCEVAIAVHGKHGFVVTKFHPLTLTVKFCAGPHFSWNCAMDFFWPRSPCSPGATMSADFLKVFQQQTAKVRLALRHSRHHKPFAGQPEARNVRQLLPQPGLSRVDGTQTSATATGGAGSRRCVH